MKRITKKIIFKTFDLAKEIVSNKILTALCGVGFILLIVGLGVSVNWWTVENISKLLDNLIL